ncbi:hypothetical protein CBL_03221 [Carabus blaptoides fortunei]
MEGSDRNSTTTDYYYSNATESLSFLQSTNRYPWERDTGVTYDPYQAYIVDSGRGPCSLYDSDSSARAIARITSSAQESPGMREIGAIRRASTETHFERPLAFRLRSTENSGRIRHLELSKFLDGHTIRITLNE